MDEQDDRHRFKTFSPSTYVDRVDEVSPRISQHEDIIKYSISDVSINPFDYSASRYERKDNNNLPCALLIVYLPIKGCHFSGNIIGNTEYHTNEYWVYLTGHTKYLKIQIPGASSFMVDFCKYGFMEGLRSRYTYYLINNN